MTTPTVTETRRAGGAVRPADAAARVLADRDRALADLAAARREARALADRVTALGTALDAAARDAAEVGSRAATLEHAASLLVAALLTDDPYAANEALAAAADADVALAPELALELELGE